MPGLSRKGLRRGAATFTMAPLRLTLYQEKRDRINTYTLNSGNLPWKKLMERVI